MHKYIFIYAHMCVWHALCDVTHSYVNGPISPIYMHMYSYIHTCINTYLYMHICVCGMPLSHEWRNSLTRGGHWSTYPEFSFVDMTPIIRVTCLIRTCVMPHPRPVWHDSLIRWGHRSTYPKFLAQSPTPRSKFSKVCLRLNVSYDLTMELTFEKFCQ